MYTVFSQKINIPKIENGREVRAWVCCGWSEILSAHSMPYSSEIQKVQLAPE